MVTPRKTGVNHREKNPQRFAVRKRKTALEMYRMAPNGDSVAPVPNLLWYRETRDGRTLVLWSEMLAGGCRFARRGPNLPLDTKLDQLTRMHFIPSNAPSLSSLLAMCPIPTAQ